MDSALWPAFAAVIVAAIGAWSARQGHRARATPDRIDELVRVSDVRGELVDALERKSKSLEERCEYLETRLTKCCEDLDAATANLTEAQGVWADERRELTGKVEDLMRQLERGTP